MDTGEEVIIAIEAEAGAAIPDAIILFDPSVHKGTRTQLRQLAATTFVSLGPLPSGELEVSIEADEEETAGLSIETRPKVEDQFPPAIEVHFDTQIDSRSRVVKCPLHSRALRSHLSAVAQAAATIRSLNIPSALQLRVVIRKRTPGVIDPEYFVPGKPEQLASRTVEAAVALITDAIRRGDQVELDGGPFGRISFALPRVKEEKALAPLRLSHLLRARANWLRSNSRGLGVRELPTRGWPVNGNGTDIRDLIRRFCSDDQVLLKSLFQSDVPPSIQPQMRSFVGQLRNYARANEMARSSLPQRAIG
jgi:hypothetical protein